MTAPAALSIIRSTDGRYLLSHGNGLCFEVDRLRRERHELVGELAVYAEIAGAPTVDGCLSIGSFNLSSPRARTERATLLSRASRTGNALDWPALLEEVCQRVLAAERAGRPGVHLRDVEPRRAEAAIDIDGFRLLRHHPAMIFGDGDTLKSYFALYLAGRLTERGIRVLYCDWELDQEDHRERLEQLFGREMPDVIYARCDRPLVSEADRLRRIITQERCEFAVQDSVAFGCDGPPEAAEAASVYYRALRSLNVGSILIAHTNRSDTGDQKPFGSVFWHNGARLTYFAKRAEETAQGEPITVGLYCRKSNTGPRPAAIGFEFTFSEFGTRVRRVDLAASDDLAPRLPLWQRMRHTLRAGPKTMATIAEELDAKVGSVEKVVDRSKGRMFVRAPGTDGVTRIALVERRV